MREKFDGKIFGLLGKRLFIILALSVAVLILIVLYCLVFSKALVPDLVGKSCKKAQSVAKQSNLKITVSKKRFSARYDEGIVISQKPKAGARVAKHSEVKVVVSKGPERKDITKVGVPSVLKLTLEEAIKKLEESGLKAFVKEEKSGDAIKGIVVSQHPSPDEKVKKGTTVKILVSSKALGTGADGGDISASSKGKTVCIDAGHQARADLSREPIGPGSSTTKERVRGGSRGVSSGTPEYEITLDISLKLKDLLKSAGYQVVMVRESHDVNISASERAQIANNAHSGLFIRIHCDGSANSSTNGISTLYPASNQWTSPIYSSSKQAAQIIQHNLVRTCGRADRGIIARGDITGFNWSKVPVVLVEAGFLSNPTEDAILASTEGQNQVAQGIYLGVVEYFEGQ